MKELNLVALNGFLGYGYELESLEAGLESGPAMLGCDAGSTDAGPYYLGSGSQLVKEPQVYRDLSHALRGARRLGIPLVIGSAGTAGGEPHLRSLVELLRRSAAEDSLHFKLAQIHAEIDRDLVLRALQEGRIEAMPGAPELTARAVRDSERIVGQMGTGPFIRALSEGAEVIIAGRACDASIFAALPIMLGFDPGLSLHLAKVIECGALCARPPSAGDSVLGTIRADHFSIRPLNRKRRVSPESVASHSLYEQPDPGQFEEPEGTVDLSAAEYESASDGSVRVSGSRFRRRPGGSTIKLEGARLEGYRAVTIAGIRDFGVLAHLQEIEEETRSMVERNLDPVSRQAGYRLLLRYYGRDAVLGPNEPLARSGGHEVGVVIEAIACTQAEADNILALARSSFLHCSFPGRTTTAGNLAFPFSPSDLPAGRVYSFSVYHLLHGADEQELFPVEVEQL
ncbi:MAG: acyclic terpene utilization AtuA family protein [Spirochaetales bacterium]|nr:acyclic terpene utilization AtuA family protein [Spirochaetales bacterium]